LSPSSKWSRFEHVNGASAGIATPTITQAARGRAIWSLLTHDPATGAVTAVFAGMPDAGDGDRITSKQLLGPSPAENGIATKLSHQIEGSLAVRAGIPVDAKGVFKPGGPMRNVEVVWENFEDGTSGRARIADAGACEKGDVGMEDGAYTLVTGLA